MFVIGSSASSSSQQRENFEAATKMITTFIGKYKISPTDTKIGVVTYGGRVAPVIQLGSIQEKNPLLNAVADVRFPGAGSTLHMGINAASTMLTGARKDGVPQKIILVLDAKPMPMAQTVLTGLNQRKVEVTAIGIGREVGIDNIRELSSDKKGITVDNANQLDAVVEDLAKPGREPS